MPNTALTSTLNNDLKFPVFDMIVRAAIFKKTVFEWMTEKERTRFNAEILRGSVFWDRLTQCIAICHAARNYAHGGWCVKIGTINQAEALYNTLSGTPFVSYTAQAVTMKT